MTIGIRILFVVSVVLCQVMPAGAAVVIENLQVEYRKTPLGIDVAQPRFSWQMSTTKAERGYVQTAYRIEVRDPAGRMVWDTQKTDGARSIGIQYAGSPLKAATRYVWTVTV